MSTAPAFLEMPLDAGWGAQRYRYDFDLLLGR
jgi:hypothetical protein